MGGWRDDSTGPMQVISGPIGRERVHCEAPAAGRVDQEIEAFLDWFNTGSDIDGVLKTGGCAQTWVLAVLVGVWVMMLRGFRGLQSYLGW